MRPCPRSPSREVGCDETAPAAQCAVRRGVTTQIPDVVRECGGAAALVVTDHGVLAARVVDRVLDALDVPRSVYVTGSACATEVAACRDALPGHDGVIAVGGGSVIDVAKAAVALFGAEGPLESLYGLDQVRGPAMPLVAVPTTPGSGGEVSSHAVVTDGDRRHAVSGAPLVPRAVVIDPDLAVTLPYPATLACALDALMHGAEAYLARAATPFSDALALPGVRRIVSSLLTPDRVELSAGCLQANLAMAQANAGLVHALGYPLTQRYGIPHGIANVTVAPAVLRASRHAQEQRDAELAECFGTPDLACGLTAFLDRLGVERDFPAGDADQLAADALHYRPVRANWRFEATVDDIAAMYRSAA
ncbi:iron-containing alcohol dehydrogenase [Lentzea sp. PSKA42]|uniref:Iron-containing alcohol dehydrogenase n=1 Tax=Lentzea indica TaxID=2604800 RepID=A0ABX1FF37_9PSEU|nr:iron-containing alcohol dehydrogenase [Lentzea indica]NKE57584.1 iron-containing alcohol dehydrogenase [Lentzea indica]